MKLRIKQIRVRLGLSQKEVAAQCGMPSRRYGSYEREERTLSIIDAARIADVLDCTLDELAGRDWPPPDTAAATGMDARLARINEQYADMNERGQIRASESVDDIHANPNNRAGVSPETEAVGRVREAV